MKASERENAISLRQNGKSIKEIASILGVSKSSVSVWVRDVFLNDEVRENIKQKGVEKSVLVLRVFKQSQSNKRDGEIRRSGFREDGWQMAKSDVDFRVLCALYWGEGFKNKNVFSISNCDVSMMRFVSEWLSKNGFQSKVGFRVQYYGDNGISEDEIRCFWKESLPWVKSENFKKFTRVLINRASQKKGIGKQPYGTGILTVCNTRLVQMIFGGIEFIKGNVVQG